MLWGAAINDKIYFMEGYNRYFEELKTLDKDIVLNSIKLKWNLVKNEFQDLTKDLKFN